MRLIAVALLAFSLFAPAEAQQQQWRTAMDIQRNGSQPSSKGPAAYFTGSVRIDTRFQAPDPARVGGAVVKFASGAHTAWHTHPLDQTLIVTSDLDWAQREGGPI